MDWGVGRGCRGRMYAVRYGGRSWLFGRSVSARVGLSTEVTEALSRPCARALSVIGTGGIQREVNRRSSVAVAACMSPSRFLHIRPPPRNRRFQFSRSSLKHVRIPHADAVSCRSTLHRARRRAHNPHNRYVRRRLRAATTPVPPHGYRRAAARARRRHIFASDQANEHEAGRALRTARACARH